MAGFISEWWPESNRNGGRHQIGIPGRIASEFAHVAGFNLGVLMRAVYGQGTPREAAEAVSALIFVLQSDAALIFALIATVDGELAAIVIVAADPTRN